MAKRAVYVLEKKRAGSKHWEMCEVCDFRRGYADRQVHLRWIKTHNPHGAFRIVRYVPAEPEKE